jgi:hypothetical protein
VVEGTPCPNFHGLAEDQVWNIAGRQMCDNRKTVWTGTDDGNLTEFTQVSFLRGLSSFLLALKVLGRYVITPTSPDLQ